MSISQICQRLWAGKVITWNIVNCIFVPTSEAGFKECTELDLKIGKMLIKKLLNKIYIHIISCHIYEYVLNVSP